jgi:hypothetical protein
MSQRSRLHALLLVICVLGALLACKKKSDNELSPEARQRADALKPEVKQRLQQIAALAPKVKEGPKATSETSHKTRFIETTGEAWLVDPTRSGSSEEIDLGSAALSVCKRIVDSERMTKDDLESLEHCARINQVAVVESRDLTKPEIDIRAKSYDPGKFRGYVYVFDLPSGALVAYQEVTATNSEELELDKSNPDEGHWYRLAMSDLTTNAKSAVQKSLLPPVPAGDL